MPTEYVIFENNGEIDPLLITTFGVNVKEGDNAIGFFGTGLKYALSILLREGCEVWIQSGTEQHQFAKQTIELRGKPFEFVTMDGKPLGFTTEVGKKWELWMAYRELYCNATDEQGGVSRSKAMPEPTEGFTRVIVRGDKFNAVADEHGRYFLIGEPAMPGNLVNRHSGHSAGVYYRRVLVGQLSGKPTLFTYNLVTHMQLTEDRTLRYPFMASHAIARSIVISDDEHYIRQCVLAADVFHESELQYDTDEDPSAAFMSVMAACVKDNISKVAPSARVKYEKHCKARAKPDLVELNAVEQAALEKARAFCEKIGFHIDYPIVTVESLGSEVYGMASNETIFLAHRAFMVGVKCVAGTLIEEYVHLKHGHADYTRGFQNYIIDRLVGMGEQIIGEPL